MKVRIASFQLLIMFIFWYAFMPGHGLCQNSKQRTSGLDLLQRYKVGLEVAEEKRVLGSDFMVLRGISCAAISDKFVYSIFAT